MSAYSAVLLLHSLLRWAVLVVGLILLAQASLGWLRARSWTRSEESLHVILVALMDAQFALGLWLYLLLSPVTRAFLADVGAGTRDPVLRFFGAEHVLLMTVAVAIAHLGRVAARRASTPRQRQARVSVATLLLLLVVLAGIPWPSLRYGRPLIRGAANQLGARIELLKA